MTKRIIRYAFIATLIAVGYLVLTVIVEPLHRAKAQSLSLTPTIELGTPSITLFRQSPRYLSVSCGPSLTVNINLDTGVVDFPEGCNLDDVAKAFWTALGVRMPLECKQ